MDISRLSATFPKLISHHIGVNKPEEKPTQYARDLIALKRNKVSKVTMRPFTCQLYYSAHLSDGQLTKIF